MDKQNLLHSYCIESIYNSILSGEAISSPELLVSFLLLVFSDLKQYKFTYWLGVPAILPTSPYVFSTQGLFPANSSSERSSGSNTLVLLKDLVRDCEQERNRERSVSEQLTIDCVPVHVTADDAIGEGVRGEGANRSTEGGSEPLIRERQLSVREEWYQAGREFTDDQLGIVEVDNIGRKMVLEIYRYMVRTSCMAFEGGSPLQCVFALRALDTQLRALSLRDAWSERYDASTFIVCFDMSASPFAFGWNVRNLLALLSVHARDGESPPVTARIIGLRGPLAQQIAR